MFPTDLTLHDLALQRQRDLLDDAARERLRRQARGAAARRSPLRRRLAAVLYALAALLDDRRPIAPAAAPAYPEPLLQW